MISRYQDAPRTWAPHKSGRQVEVVFRWPTIWINQPYVSRRAVASDTMPTIAFNHYGGDATQYWRIADMNPAVVCPDDLTPGQVLRLPIIG